MVTFGGIGLQQSLIFYVSRPGTSVRRVVSRTVGLVMVIAAFIAICLSAAAPYIGASLGVQQLVPLVALAAGLELPTTCVQPAFVATERFRSAARWDVAGAALQLTAVVCGALMGGVRGAVIGLLITASVRFATVVVVVRALPHHHLDDLGRPPRVAEQLAFALPLGLTLATGVLTRSVDKWFIASFHPDQIGGYAIAAQEIPLLAVVPYAGSAAVARRLTDAFAIDDRTTARSLWLAQTAAMSRFVVPLSMALILCAPAVVPLATDSHQPALVITFALFSAITLHRVAEYGLLLRAAGRPRDLFVSGVLLLGANTLLAGIGAWRWGLIGTAAGTLCANAIAWCWVIHRVAKALGTGFGDAFPWAHWAGFLATSTLAGCAAFGAGVAMRGAAARVVVELAAFSGLVLLADRFWMSGQRSRPGVATS